MTIKTPSNPRLLHTKVKTARGRKSSSTKWLQRQLNDPYVHRARKEGYRSRAAYKILEMNEKFKFFKKNQTIIDLGAAPGGWTQIAAEKSNNSHILAIDLLEIEPIPGAICIKNDFLKPEIENIIAENLPEKKVDLILSDMAAPTSGHPKTDHIRIMNLCEAVFDFASTHLKANGTCICKIFQGGTEADLLQSIKKQYKAVKHYKPPASRKDSAETYIIAQGFKGNK